jgi:hypothetical protein
MGAACPWRGLSTLRAARRGKRRLGLGGHALDFLALPHTEPDVPRPLPADLRPAPRRDARWAHRVQVARLLPRSVRRTGRDRAQRSARNTSTSNRSATSSRTYTGTSCRDTGPTRGGARRSGSPRWRTCQRRGSMRRIARLLSSGCAPRSNWRRRPARRGSRSTFVAGVAPYIGGLIQHVYCPAEVNVCPAEIAANASNVRGLSWCVVQKRRTGQRLTYAAFAHNQDPASTTRIPPRRGRDRATGAPPSRRAAGVHTEERSQHRGTNLSRVFAPLCLRCSVSPCEPVSSVRSVVSRSLLTPRRFAATRPRAAPIRTPTRSCPRPNIARVYERQR